MDLRDYQEALDNEPVPGVMEQAQQLARHLRFITHMARLLGYSLEELASLDMEGT